MIHELKTQTEFCKAVEQREEKIYEQARAIGFTEHARLYQVEKYALEAKVKELEGKVEIAKGALVFYADIDEDDLCAEAKSALEELNKSKL